MPSPKLIKNISKAVSKKPSEPIAEMLSFDWKSTPDAVLENLSPSLKSHGYSIRPLKTNDDSLKFRVKGPNGTNDLVYDWKDEVGTVIDEISNYTGLRFHPIDGGDDMFHYYLSNQDLSPEEISKLPDLLRGGF